MEIEIWSDLICPFCGLGNQRLDNALRRFAHADSVTVVHRSFELNPSAPVGEVRTVREMLRERYGMSDAQLKVQHARIEADAAAEGLVPYEVTDNRVGSTALAHELLAYASEQGLGAEAWHHLYRAYFGEVRSIFTVDALVELAVEIGLDADSTRAVLTDRRYRDRVRRAARGAGARCDGRAVHRDRPPLRHRRRAAGRHDARHDREGVGRVTAGARDRRRRCSLRSRRMRSAGSRGDGA